MANSLKAKINKCTGDRVVFEIRIAPNIIQCTHWNLDNADCIETEGHDLEEQLDIMIEALNKKV
jgi:hypothetical protein